MVHCQWFCRMRISPYCFYIVDYGFLSVINKKKNCKWLVWVFMHLFMMFSVKMCDFSVLYVAAYIHFLHECCFPFLILPCILFLHQLPYCILYLVLNGAHHSFFFYMKICKEVVTAPPLFIILANSPGLSVKAASSQPRKKLLYLFRYN